MDVYTAVKNSVGFVCRNVAIGFLAVAVGRNVLDSCVVIVMLAALGYYHAIEFALGTFAFKADMQIVAAQGAAKAYSVAFKARAELLAHAGGAYMLHSLTFGV